LQSGNVLLTASGEARLSDVGLSRHAAFGGSAATDVKGIGTFAWMVSKLPGATPERLGPLRRLDLGLVAKTCWEHCAERCCCFDVGSACLTAL
jgi:hypothetical protein